MFRVRVTFGILVLGLVGCGARPTVTAMPTATTAMEISEATEVSTLAAVEPTATPERRIVELLVDEVDELVEDPSLESAPLYDPLELELVARINQYRVANGLWPLRPNDDLRRLALSQAVYVASLQEVPMGYGIHLGPEGDDPALRALKIGWPTYNTTAQIAVGENAYIGASFDTAMDYWTDSEIHNKTMLNAGFREIGVGISDQRGYKVMLVFFGGRPNVLPALYDPFGARLFLSSERYKWSAGGTWIHDVTQVAVVDQGAAADVFGAWSLSTSLPGEATRMYEVIYSDGATTAEAQVNPRADIAWLPENLHLNDEAMAESGVEIAPTPTVEAGSPTVQIVYDAQSLSVVNITDGVLDLIGVELAGGGWRLPLTLWGDEIGAMLSAFPGRNCLQLWSVNVVNDRIAPNGCSARVGVIYVASDKLFWRQGDFVVRQNGVEIAICRMGGEVCSIAVR